MRESIVDASSINKLSVAENSCFGCDVRPGFPYQLSFAVNQNGNFELEVAEVFTDGGGIWLRVDVNEVERHSTASEPLMELPQIRSVSIRDGAVSPGKDKDDSAIRDWLDRGSCQVVGDGRSRSTETRCECYPHRRA